MANTLLDALESYKTGNYLKALKSVSPFLARRPLMPEAVLIAAQCNTRLERYKEATALYEKMAGLQKDKRRFFLKLAAGLHLRAGDGVSALRIARDAARSGPFDREAEEIYRRAMRSAMAFDEWKRENSVFLDGLRKGDAARLSVDSPFDAMHWLADEEVAAQLTRVQNGTAFTPASRAARQARPHDFGPRIHVGYLSNDISDQHATLRLLQGVLLAHDRTRFKITLFCYTEQAVARSDQGFRNRFADIVAIGHLSDAEAADRIRNARIDILVDVKGHTKHARIDLVNLGLAPIQVAYLGFPGSVTGIDCDYAITDRIVTPDGSKPHYHEKLCRMPETYQANDDTYRALPPAMTRARAGLPATGVVFASFNGMRKMTPETIALWSRILHAVDGSVLWMMCDSETERTLASRCFADAGIERARIVFADRLAYPDHIARLQAADIGLDTFPYNGHTTTSDKLWAGLPVPTLRGTHFASRVSESLLTALGVADLVAADADGYVDLCVRLAKDAAWRQSVRDRIERQRFRAPLFDTERFTRHLETAYRMMVDRAKAGLAADHIDVPALPARAEPFGRGPEEDGLGLPMALRSA